MAAGDDDDEAAVKKSERRSAAKATVDRARGWLEVATQDGPLELRDCLHACRQPAVTKMERKKNTRVEDSDEDETGGAAYVSLHLGDLGINEGLCSLNLCVTSGSGGELAAWE